MAEDTDTLPQTHWQRESIRAERLEMIQKANLSQEELIRRVADLETALYPFVAVLHSLNDESWCGTNASSKLFPMLAESGAFLVYENKKSVEVERASIPESELHKVDYYTEDSINIMNGAKLDDLFTIIDVHQQAPGAYVGCGSIVMGDVRYAAQVLTPRTPIESAPVVDAPEVKCTCLSDMALDAYSPGGPSSGHPLPPPCKLHPNGKSDYKPGKNKSNVLRGGPIKD